METEEKNERLVYEISYHLIPTIDEAEVPAKASEIKSLVESQNGIIISEELPKPMVLAYEISKSVGGKKHDFNRAYFGWLKFEAEPDRIGAIKTKIENLEEVLRFLMIKTVRENIMHTPRIPMFRKENAPKEEKAEGEADKPKASEAEMDKSIDELLVGEKSDNKAL